MFPKAKAGLSVDILNWRDAFKQKSLLLVMFPAIDFVVNDIDLKHGAVDFFILLEPGYGNTANSHTAS